MRRVRAVQSQKSWGGATGESSTQSPQSEVLEPRDLPGTRSLGTAWPRLLHIQDWRPTLGRVPECYCSTAETPKGPPGKAFCSQNL